MNRIYQVKYEEQWNGCRDWIPESKNVLGNGDAIKVVDKVRRQSLAKNFKDEKTGDVLKCVGFRLREISILAEDS